MNSYFVFHLFSCIFILFHFSRFFSICSVVFLFYFANTDDDMDQDWVRLGKLLQRTNHRSKEADDLYDNLLNGKLKG
jgi:hypothetical protein